MSSRVTHLDSGNETLAPAPESSSKRAWIHASVLKGRKETHMKTVRIFAVALLIVASGSALRVAHSQQTAIKRTELQRHDLSIPGREIGRASCRERV